MLATSKAFGARALERRVHALLEEPPLARSMQHLVLPVVAASLLALGLSFELHHLTESLLALAAP
jgi:hypothetical protein